jgi:hypothetical protein
MRYVFGLVSAFALALALMAGCSDENGGGGTGGSGGTGGTHLCEGVVCDDGEPFCTVDVCNPEDGMCVYTPVEDGTSCVDSGIEGTCLDGVCKECHIDADCNDYKDCTNSCFDGICDEPVAVQDGTPCAGGMCGSGECILEGSVLPCTEQGIRNAIAAGGGPYTFACDGPRTVVTEATIYIDNDVILDGEGNLTVDGDEDHGVFLVFRDVAAELRGFTVTKGNGCCERGEGGGISNGGTLTLTHSTVSGNFSDVGGISNGGTLTLTHSTVSGNRGGYGGGIFNYGTLTLTNSTLSGNTAVFGGAIFIGGGTGGTATLTNCTVSGNSAEDGGAFWGGGGDAHQHLGRR